MQMRATLPAAAASVEPTQGSIQEGHRNGLMYKTTCFDTLALAGDPISPKTKKQNIFSTYQVCKRCVFI